MYKICKTEQSALRQRELELGLLSLMREKSYEEISVCDLCDRMGIPRKAFYRYFSCKDGALQALMDHTLMEYSTFVDDRLDLVSFFEFWRRQKPLLEAIERNGLFSKFILRIVEYAVQEEHITDREKTYKMNFILCGLMSMVLTWYYSGFRSSPKEMARSAKAILTTPLITDNIIREIKN